MTTPHIQLDGPYKRRATRKALLRWLAVAAVAGVLVACHIAPHIGGL